MITIRLIMDYWECDEDVARRILVNIISDMDRDGVEFIKVDDREFMKYVRNYTDDELQLVRK
jgi:Glu-tRNA(Gln) amidotransferase subunit E-like FAD-binding protein